LAAALPFTRRAGRFAFLVELVRFFLVELVRFFLVELVRFFLVELAERTPHGFAANPALAQFISDSSAW